MLQLNNINAANPNYINKQAYPSQNEKYLNYPNNNQYNQYPNNNNQYGVNSNQYPNNQYPLNNQYGANSQYGGLNNNQYGNDQYRPSGQLPYQPSGVLGGGYGQQGGVYGSNPCQQRPCYNEGQCVPTGPYTFQCQCRYNYHGQRCENYRNPKAVLIGIVLGTVLPFFALVIICSCVAYFCCCKRKHAPLN